MKNKTLIITITVILIVGIALAIVVPLLFIPKDFMSPTVTINTPKSADIVSGSINVSISAKDDITSADQLRFEIYIDNQLFSYENQFMWNTTNFSEGAHTIKAEVYDKAGNMGIASVTFIIDNIIFPPPSDCFKILEYNIMESGAFHQWKDVVEEENPDIAVFVETGKWDDNGNKQLHSVLNTFNNYFLNESPYRGYTAQHIHYSTSGEAIISRYPFINFTQISRLTLDNNETYNPTHDFIDGVLNISGTAVHVIGAHLKCCDGENNEQRRNYEQEGIINYMDSLGDVPIIYIGDLNSHSPDDNGSLAAQMDLGTGPVTMLLYPNNSTYGNFSSHIHTFTDVFRALNPTDPGYTYGPDNPSAVGRIDYIFVNQFLAHSLINSTVGAVPDAAVGSDHLPLDAFIAINFTTNNSDKIVNELYYSVQDSEVLDNYSCQFINNELSPALTFPFGILALMLAPTKGENSYSFLTNSTSELNGKEK